MRGQFELGPTGLEVNKSVVWGRDGH